MKKNILITQSNYIPWKGYFDAISRADIWVVFDSMQYTKRDWRNRNLVKTDKGTSWLSIPIDVKGKYEQKINEAIVSDPKWVSKHLNVLKQWYGKAPFFEEVFDWLSKEYYSINSLYLSEINVKLIQKIMAFLDISTEVYSDVDFDLHPDKTTRLVEICKKLDGTHYLTGPAAKAYMDEGVFGKSGISVEYMDYSGYPKYHQLFGDFDHGVSILDMLFNMGGDSKKLIHGNKGK